MTLVYTILALLATSIGSVMLSSTMLLLNDKWLHRVSEYLLYLAGGTLLGSALLGLIPEAAHEIHFEDVLLWLAIGIVFFFILEKIILWRTCHDEHCERQSHTAAPMILIGDAFHNAIDGVVIAASFITSVELGIFVTISVVLHEIPQELGDFGILIKSGYSRRKALLYNLLSGSTSLLAGILAYFLLDFVQSVVPYALAIAAASFMYVAMADLIPEMHKETKFKPSIVQILLIIAGLAIIYFSAQGHQH